MALSRNFDQVCKELDHRRHVTLGLERIEGLLALLGHPEEPLRVAQVVGTNGKGTTAAALAAALEESGSSAGTYLSPHVLSYTERMMVRGEYISEDRFATVMDPVMEVADEGGVPASQFEILTAGALALFREEALEWAVLEAGLGARYDATTAARPEAVVLTNVGLEHTEYLGETIGEIAVEKLASLPRGGVLVLGDESPEVVELARRKCERVGARLVEPAEEFPLLSRHPAAEHLAPYAIRNICLGIRAAEVVLDEAIGSEVRERVFRRVEGMLLGRFETHEVGGVPVVVDGGHNLDGLRTALESVREVYGDRYLGVVFGVLRDKDIGSMLTALRKEADSLILTRPENYRAAEPDLVYEQYGPRDRRGREARIVVGAEEALDEILGEIGSMGGVVLVTGSLYTGASILERLRAG